VRHRRETRERTIEQLARGAAAGVRDQADAAGVALELLIVEKGAGAQRYLPPFQGPRNGCVVPPAGVSVS
jgi:hypothetical protein